jgi:hypothetical protein
MRGKRARARAGKILNAIAKEPDLICLNCDHPKMMHGTYGCLMARADALPALDPNLICNCLLTRAHFDNAG